MARKNWQIVYHSEKFPLPKLSHLSCLQVLVDKSPTWETSCIIIIPDYNSWNTFCTITLVIVKVTGWKQNVSLFLLLRWQCYAQCWLCFIVHNKERHNKQNLSWWSLRWRTPSLLKFCALLREHRWRKAMKDKRKLDSMEDF